MTRPLDRHHARRGAGPQRPPPRQPAADAALQLNLPLFDLPPTDPPASPTRMPTGLRTTMLCAQPVHYELRRSRRRTISFVIDDRGLRVTAPRWVPLAEIERALQKKAS